MEQSADRRGLDLVFRSITVEDGGEYACEAIIDGENEKEEFELNVIGGEIAQLNRLKLLS